MIFQSNKARMLGLERHWVKKNSLINCVSLSVIIKWLKKQPIYGFSTCGELANAVKFAPSNRNPLVLKPNSDFKVNH